MERKGGLKVGEGGLIADSPYVSLQILPLVIFLYTNHLPYSESKSVPKLAGSGTHLFTLCPLSVSRLFYNCVRKQVEHSILLIGSCAIGFSLPWIHREW